MTSYSSIIDNNSLWGIGESYSDEDDITSIETNYERNAIGILEDSAQPNEILTFTSL